MIDTIVISFAVSNMRFKRRDVSFLNIVARLRSIVEGYVGGF